MRVGDANPDWTVKEALAAQTRFEKKGGRDSDPTGPVFQWAALQELKAYEAQYLDGHKPVVLLAVSECARTGLVMPNWLVKAFLRAFRTGWHYEAKSWDEVFGAPLPKGAHISALQKKRKYSMHVWNEINRRHRELKRPIDDELFAEVGKELGLGCSLTKEYYSLQKRRMKEMPPPVKKLLDHVLADIDELKAAPPSKK